MAGLTRTTYGGSPDRRSLVTDRGVGTGIGCTLTAAAFVGQPLDQASGVITDHVPAMYPITVDATGMATPFAGTSGTPTALSGFTLNDVDISGGDNVTGYLSRGDIDPAFLPVPFDPAGAGATSTGSFKFDAKA